MPLQRLSLFSPLEPRLLEEFVKAIQTLTTSELIQFKSLIKVYKDDSTPQGRRPSDFIRVRIPWNLSTTPKSPSSNPASGEQPTRVRSQILERAVLEVVDAPEVHKRPVTSRIIHLVPCTSGDPRKLVNSMGYDLTYSYFEQGYELRVGSIMVRIFQIFKAESTANSDDQDEAQAHADEDEDEKLEGLAIGESGTWIVQADADVRPGQPDDLRRGVDELLRFKRDVQGYVDLIVLTEELR